MPKFTVRVTVELTTDTQQEAYSDIRLALAKSKRAEIVHVDSEVIDEQPDEDEHEPSAAELSAAFQRVLKVANG